MPAADIVTEVYFDFGPLALPALMPAQRLYFRAVWRPRPTAILAIQDEE